MAMSSSIQPIINIKPPIGVISPIPETPTLFIAFKEASKYKEPEKRKIPIIKNVPA
jgi:hypothetical protein